MKKWKNILLYIALLLIIWVVLSQFIQAMMCPKLTQMEVFLHTPKSMMFDFIKCNQ